MLDLLPALAIGLGLAALMLLLLTSLVVVTIGAVSPRPRRLVPRMPRPDLTTRPR